MNIEETIELITKERTKGNKTFLIEYSDGRIVEKRLFVSGDNSICEYAKGARRRGYYLALSEVVNIRPAAIKKRQPWEVAERNRKRALAYLVVSGLNPQLRKKLEDVGEITEAHKAEGSFDFLYSEHAIKSPDYTSRGDRMEWREKELKAKIKVLAPFHEAWRGRSYDISMSIDTDGRAFYSEEYRNCGNGHYFLLLDERHAIHVEDD